MDIGSASSILLTTLLGYTRFKANSQDNVNNPADATIVALLNLEMGKLQTRLIGELLFDWQDNTLEGTGNGLKNLTDATQSYAWPTGMLAIDRIEVNYTGMDNGWVVARVVKQQSIDGALANTANDNVIEGSYNNPVVWVKNGYFYLDPIPYQTITNGMKIYCVTGLTDLAIAGTGDALTPRFPSQFHHILSIGAAEQWLKSQDKYSKAQGLEQEKELEIQKMLNFYVKRENTGTQSGQISTKARSMN